MFFKLCCSILSLHVKFFSGNIGYFLPTLCFTFNKNGIGYNFDCWLFSDTHFIYGYVVSDIVKDHLSNERGNLLPQFHMLLIPKDLLYTPSHRQDSTYQGLC